MSNPTMTKFGYPDSLIVELDHWVVLLRPAQVTLGSLILCAKAHATAFADLPAAAFAELAVATRGIESALRRAVDYERINYLMLMMVDPNVHFHVIPRYQGTRARDGLTLEDHGWPGPPTLGRATSLDPDQFECLLRSLKSLVKKENLFTD